MSKSFGEWLRSERKKKGMTMRQFSSLLNVSDAYISQLENERQGPGIDTIVSISEKLGVPFLSLLSMLDYPIYMNHDNDWVLKQNDRLKKENDELRRKLGEIKNILKG